MNNFEESKARFREIARAAEAMKYITLEVDNDKRIIIVDIDLEYLAGIDDKEWLRLAKVVFDAVIPLEILGYEHLGFPGCRADISDDELIAAGIDPLRL